jgi:hypothetical protein
VPRPVERRGLGAVDVLAIVIVIGLLGVTLATLVAARSGHAVIDVPEWAQRLVVDLVSLPRSQGEASPPAEPRR